MMIGNEPATASGPDVVPRTGVVLALRPRDAAKALGVSQRTLWEWTQRGDVPHVRRGRTLLYPVKAVEAWLACAAKRKPENEQVTN